MWSGSSGAVGSGPRVSVTFYTVSSSTTDYKVVTATAGNSFSANVIVYDITPTLTPSDNFSGRDLENFGLAENITLTPLLTPSITAAEAGGLLWTLDNGGGNLIDNGDGTGSLTVANVTGQFMLGLQVKAGPSKNRKKQTTPKGVLAPTGLHFEVRPPVSHTQGVFSIGVSLYIYTVPKASHLRTSASARMRQAPRPRVIWHKHLQVTFIHREFIWLFMRVRPQQVACSTVPIGLN